MSQQLITAKQQPLPGFRIRRHRVSNGHPRVKPIQKIRNVSNEVDRCAFNTLERIFSEHWQREAAPRGSVNSGFGILQELFIRTKGSGVFESRKIDLLINQRDATVAATVESHAGSMNSTDGSPNEVRKKHGVRALALRSGQSLTGSGSEIDA